MNTAYLLNTLWRWQGMGEAHAFRRAMRDVRDVQRRLLDRLLQTNAQTDYGRRYGFASIRSVDEFQQRVPLVQYEDLQRDIQRIAAGERNVLTAERVLLLEPTGGSTAGEKWIPYTSTLRRQFQRALAVWISDVMGRISGVRGGRAYWSISPAASQIRRTEGGVPVGFEHDRDYLGWWQRRIASRLLVTPDAITRLGSIENFRYASLLYLLACEDLALISVWSPTFLTTLLDGLPNWLAAICDDLQDGRLRLPQAEGGVAAGHLPVPSDRRRAKRLQEVFSGHGAQAEKLRECWPRLRLISCWADAASELYAERLGASFPHVTLQGKGLLATEGVVSFPLGSKPGSVLAVRSHFFEFLEVGEGGTNASSTSAPRFADELETHGRYRVVLTTGGGLYRYDLGDQIEVIGREGRCPRIRFLGRSNATSDLVGEKLREEHVRRVVHEICHQQGIQPDFAFLAPVQAGPPRYRLFLDVAGVPADGRRLAKLAEQLDRGLSTNPQYRYARDLRQLGPAEVCLVRVPSGSAWQLYEHERRRRGQKAGDIKPSMLDDWTGWESTFAPHVSIVRSSDASRAADARIV